MEGMADPASNGRGPAMGAFGPVRFPIFPPSGKEGVGSAHELPERPFLSQVHGFHAAARPAVLFLDEHHCAVAAGRLVVLLDIAEGGQKFVAGHSDAVTCLAHSSEQACGASGQVRRAGAKCAEVLMWCPATQRVMASFVFHQADVEVVGFAQGGEVLITIAADRDHTLAMWPAARHGFFQHKRKETVPLVVSSAYKSGDVYGMMPAPDRPGAPPQFVTYGAVHVKFWQSGRLSPKLSGRRGAFGKEAAPRAVVTVAWVGSSRLVAGGSDGEVYFFEGTRAIKCVRPHPHAVALLLPLPSSLLVVSSRGSCSLVDAEAPRGSIDLASLPGAPDPRTQSLIVGGAAWQQKAVLFASKSHLLHAELEAGPQPLQSCRVLLAQPSSPITAVCAHPTEPVIITGSLDGTVRSYRSNAQGVLVPDRSFRAPAGITCIAISGCVRGASAWLALGCNDSTLVVLSEESHHYVFHRCLSPTKAQLTCAAFSTSDILHGTPLWLAVGCADGTISTFRFKEPVYRSTSHTGSETVEKVATLRGHNASVFELSFADTLPCAFLLSVDVAGQALVFDVVMARRMPSMALVKDMPFSPWKSPIGWQVAGCWQPQPEDEKARLAPRHFCEVASRSVIAVSDADAPAVELYPFPCPTPPACKPVRLGGLVELVTALIHCSFCNWLVASSDTLLFVWSWHGRGEADPHPVTPERKLAGSPAARAGNVAIYDTPTGPKHAMSPDHAGLMTPQRRTPSRSRVGLPADKVQLDFGAADDVRKPGSPAASRPPIRHNPYADDGHPGYADPAVQYGGDESFDFYGHGPRDDFRAMPDMPKSEPSTRGTNEDCDLAEVSSPGTPSANRRGVSPARPAYLRPQQHLQLHPHEHPYEHQGLHQHEHQHPHQKVQQQQQQERQERWGQEQHNMPLRSDDAEVDIDLSLAQARPWTFGLDELAQDAPREEGIQAPQALRDGRFRFAHVGEGVGETQRIREDTALRARSIHERQLHDEVGVLLRGGGGDRSSVPTHVVEAHDGACRESRIGRFVCRLRDAGSEYEVEVLLHHGQLTQVTRNPSRRTITFEGTAGAQPQGRRHGDAGTHQRLSVRMPAGFDLADLPSRLDKNFAKGWCAVAWPRLRSGLESAPYRMAWG